MARPAAASAPHTPDDITLTGLPMILAVVTLAFANFMVVLDMTIANVSVPNIAGGLAVSPSEGTWVITAMTMGKPCRVMSSGAALGAAEAARRPSTRRRWRTTTRP